MKTFCKGVLLSCAIFAGVSFASQNHADAASVVSSYQVKVQVNDQLVRFPDGQPFIDRLGHLMVPLRFVTEQVGYKINWQSHNSVVKVTLQKDQQQLIITSGQRGASLNGNPIELDSPAVLLKGRVYVPFRLFPTITGYTYDWDGTNRIAILNADGQSHKSAWTAPKLPNYITSSAATKKPNQILQTAKQYLGTPYVWGGTTPKGFDCSGFVQYVFKKNQISLPRTSSDMYAKSGARVKSPKPSDLVFFAEGKKTTHVGIYVGNNAFISATSSYGITIAKLSNSYWGPRYVGAKSVL